MWNINQSFRTELRKPVHVATVKAVVLDTNLVPVEAGEFYDDKTNEIQNFIVDGNVDIDVTRGSRRTVEMTLLNTSEEFTPNSAWTGKFYVNRAIRLYRGVVIGNDRLYAPIGTFLIDHAEVVVERNISMVVLSASDFWKKFHKSVFTKPKSYAAGTHLNTVIKDFATVSGALVPLTPALDPLVGPERSSTNTTLQSKYTYERGDNLGDKLKELCAQFGVDVFFDVNGRLTTHDRKDPKDQASVWTFSNASDGSGMLVSMRRSFNDDYLYNHVIAVATGDPKNILTYEIVDTDPNSFTNVSKIGNRVAIFENERWKTQTQVTAAAKLAWTRRFGINEEINIETICNPALDADDVITVVEGWSDTNGVYRIQHATVPLSSSRQQIRCVKLIRS